MHNLDVSLKNLKAVENNPTEFVKQLQALETELGNVSQKLTEYKKNFKKAQAQQTSQRIFAILSQL